MRTVLGIEECSVSAVLIISSLTHFPKSEPQVSSLPVLHLPFSLLDISPTVFCSCNPQTFSNCTSNLVTCTYWPLRASVCLSLLSPPHCTPHLHSLGVSPPLSCVTKASWLTPVPAPHSSFRRQFQPHFLGKGPSFMLLNWMRSFRFLTSEARAHFAHASALTTRLYPASEASPNRTLGGPCGFGRTRSRRQCDSREKWAPAGAGKAWVLRGLLPGRLSLQP